MTWWDWFAVYITLGVVNAIIAMFQGHFDSLRLHEGAILGSFYIAWPIQLLYALIVGLNVTTGVVLEYFYGERKR